jgi:hypothetical protein
LTESVIVVVNIDLSSNDMVEFRDLELLLSILLRDRIEFSVDIIGSWTRVSNSFLVFRFFVRIMQIDSD